MKRWRLFVYPVGGATLGATVSWSVRHFFGDQGAGYLLAFMLGVGLASLFWVGQFVRADRQIQRQLAQMRVEYMRALGFEKLTEDGQPVGNPHSRHVSGVRITRH